MKTKTNRTLRKILSIALCLALVMSYVPMVSITASAVESTIPVIEGYGLDSDDSEFGTTFGDSITSGSTAGDTSWSDEAGKGNLIFQWGYGDTLDVTLVDPDGVVTYETSNIQAHSDDSKSSDLHWIEFPLSSSYADGTYITAVGGFEYYKFLDDFAIGTGNVGNVFEQTASGEPGFLSDDMLIYGESIIEDGTTSMFFEHIPATFRFVITNTHEQELTLESVKLQVVEADGNSVPVASQYCGVYVDGMNGYAEFTYSNETYDSVTTNLSDYTLEPGKSYIAYALALPLGNMDTGKHDDTAFEGKTIQVEVTTSEGECIAFELAGDDIANANPNNAYNWVGGKSYTMCMETRCYDGCAFDITGKCTVCGYECTHNFDDKGFCTDCGGYQKPDVNPGENPEWEYDDIYLVENAGQLFWIANYVNNVSNEIKVLLTTDITIPEGKEWTPIMNFYGTFDGGYYTVSGLDASGDEFVGMFGGGSYAYGTIKNLHITNSRFEGTSYVGALAGYHAGNIYNCYVDSSVTVTGDSSTGLLVGHNAGAVQNCYAYGSSCVGYYDGNYSTVENCYYLSETETEDGGKTAEQFASGEVAYLLQQGNTEQVWGQDNNQTGAKPMFTSNELYKVVTVGETGNYSVASVGDTNGDGTVDINDYQAIVNTVTSGGHAQSETASYGDIIKYDLNGDGYVDALDAALMHNVIGGNNTVDVYAVGDFDLDGTAFEESDSGAIKHAIENATVLSTAEKYICDINGDGKVDENDLTAINDTYGEIDSEVHTFVGHKCKICGTMETFTVYWAYAESLGHVQRNTTYGQDFIQSFTVAEGTHLNITDVNDMNGNPINYVYEDGVLTIKAVDVPASDIEVLCDHYVEVKFDANGGVIVPEEGYPLPGDNGFADDGSYWIKKFAVGSEITPHNIAGVVCEGYTFIGWRDESGQVHDGFVIATEDVTVYAQWSISDISKTVFSTITIIN